MKKNIVLVQTHDLIVNRYLPLAISNVWLYAQESAKVKNNYQVKDVIIDKVDPEEYLDNINFAPEIFAFSVYLWNNKHTQTFARAIKERFPDCVIIVGGPQIPKDDKKFFKNNPHYDIAVLGEGEIAFREILENKCMPTNLPNVFFKNGQFPKIINRTEDLSRIPSPIQSGFYNMIMKKYNKKYKDIKWGLIYETMRGCPYHCSFCDIGESYHNKVKQFDIERVYKDIDWMSKNKIEYVSVADSNWGIFERDLDISKYVIYKKMKHGFPKHWDVSFAKNNYDRIFKIALHDKLKQTNIFKGVTFAYQSTDKDVLSAIDRFNIDPVKSKYLMSMFKKNEIAMYSELVFPLPNDTVHTLKNSIEDVLDYGQKDFLQIHTTSVQPNAPLSKKEMRDKYKLKTKWLTVATHSLDTKNKKSFLDDQEMLISTRTLSKKDHTEAYCFGWATIVLMYYGWAHYIIEYLVKTQQKKYTQIIQDIIDYSQTKKKNIFHQEYQTTKKHFSKILQNKEVWGRNIFGNKGIYFELKAASSSVFLQKKQGLYDFLEQFLVHYAGVDTHVAKQLVDFNSACCFEPGQKYPIRKNFDRHIVKTIAGIDSGNLIFDHYDKDHKLSLLEFCQKAYHWQRKNAYWRCEVKKSQ